MSETVYLADQQASRVVVGGRVVVDGDVWTLARSAVDIGQIMHALGVPRDADRGRVLAVLQSNGYWPASAGLRDYMKECRAK